jgi:hypothetical protein
MVAGLKRTGKRYVYTICEERNQVAMKATAKMGFNKIGHLSRLRCLGLTLAYISKKDLLALRSV